MTTLVLNPWRLAQATDPAVGWRVRSFLASSRGSPMPGQLASAPDPSVPAGDEGGIETSTSVGLQVRRL